MFSWITGPRITDVIEDLRPENNYESTFIEAPETPAHQFAVKAFKHAVFGTPASEDAGNAERTSERKANVKLANTKTVEKMPAVKEQIAPISPSKMSGGILMTPGTTSKGRKTVSFGSQVLDNDTKRNKAEKSGISNGCPGKFPSPWTPGTQLKLEPPGDKRPRTKLTAALLDARTTSQPQSGQKLKARDDSDITMDLGAPRSESGKYWKEQYESYAERSEKEIKKIIAKQQLAKKYAMKKDGEVTELATKLEQERKRYKHRERDLEQQNNNFQERLRQSLAESMSSSIEIAALKARIATLENSIPTPSSDIQQVKPTFQIYEDSEKEAMEHQSNTEKIAALSFAPSVSMATLAKENTPTPQPPRRRSLPHTSSRPALPTRIGTAENEVSILLGKSPQRTHQLSEMKLRRPHASRTFHSPTKSAFNAPKPERNDGTNTINPQVAALPSSPLPMPSPCPWLEVDGSSIQEMDKMALPFSAGVPYSRPEWNPPPKQTHVNKTKPQTPEASQQHPKAALTIKSEESKVAVTEESINIREQRVYEKGHKASNPAPVKDESTRKADALTHKSLTNLPKLTAHHAEGSTLVKHDKAEMLPIDRKEQARRRLQERKRQRKNALTS